MKERILFLYLKTGGGHQSAGRALSRELDDRNIETFTLNPIENHSFLINLLEKGYSNMTNGIMWLYAIVYELSKLPPFQAMYFFLLNKMVGKNVYKFIKENKITKVVSLHFLLSDMMKIAVKKIEKEENRKIHQMAVVLDPFTVHPLWVYHRDLPLILFSDRAIEHANQKRRIPLELLQKEPIILNKQFDKKISPEERLALKEKYGFRRDKKLVLIAGGGEGLAGGEKYLKALQNSDLDVDYAFVAAKNEKLKVKAEAVAAEYTTGKSIVYGFIDFMFDLMNAADMVIAKGGPATVMEALILGKPLIITQHVYGQEKGNVDYVVDNGAGFFIKKTDAMVEAAKEILGDPVKYEERVKAINALGVTNGLYNIADAIQAFDGKWSNSAALKSDT